MNATGQILAERYRLLEPLATDDELETWAADDLRLERRVRVQLPRRRGEGATGGDSAAVERFWARVRGAAQQSAAQDGRVLDAGTDGASGQVFMVREWREQPLAVAPPAVDRGADAPRRQVTQFARLPRPAPTAHAPRARRPARRWRPERWSVVGGAVVLLAVLGVTTGTALRAWLAWIDEPLNQQHKAFTLPFTAATRAVPAIGAQSGQVTATPVAPPPTVAAAQRNVASTPAPTAARPTATLSVLGNRRQIVNTDGQGVALRSGPGGDRLPGKGYDEGVIVTVLERDGTWTHIRGDDGREGWILSVTLADGP